MRRGNESVPPGVIDLTQMLDKDQKRNHMLFKIPDSEWLVNYGWIAQDQVNEGPFAVKQLQIFPLPIPSNGRGDIGPIHVSLSLVKSIWSNEEVFFDERVSNKFSYYQDDTNCPTLSMPSPYSSKAVNPLEMFAKDQMAFLTDQFIHH